MDLKLLISSFAVLYVLSNVSCQGICPAVVEYMYSFGEYVFSPLCSVTSLKSGEMSVFH